MTKDRLIRFAQASAARDSDAGIVQTRAALEQGIAGYTACLAIVGKTTLAIREPSIAAAIEAYKTQRGVFILAPSGFAKRAKRMRRRKRAATPASPWSQLFLRRQRYRRRSGTAAA